MTADGRARVLADGNEIPLLGLGVWQVPNGPECVDAVRWALELGYRHIDTAQAYGNEESVGQGLRESGVPREEVFITTKFFPARKDPVAEVERSLQRLGVDYVDLYIVHWPEGGPTWAWPGMERARELGYARSIGVSNFGVDDLRQLLATATVPPVVDQVQFSPYEYRKALLDSCRAERDRAGGLQPPRNRPPPRQRHGRADRAAPRAHSRPGAAALVHRAGHPGHPEVDPPRAHRRERPALRLPALGPGHRASSTRSTAPAAPTARSNANGGEANGTELAPGGDRRGRFARPRARRPRRPRRPDPPPPARPGRAVRRPRARDRLPATRRPRRPGDLRAGARSRRRHADPGDAERGLRRRRSGRPACRRTSSPRSATSPRRCSTAPSSSAARRDEATRS